jgi:mono/diheme cytochrome c family protein
MHKGEQYIVTYAGGGLFGGKKGDGVWLFSLGGNLVEVPETPTGDRFGRGNPDLSGIDIPEGHEPDIANGRKIYNQSCVYCHGETGEGGHGGGAELTSSLDVNDIMTILGTGRNGMPSFRFVFQPEQAHDVASFLVSELLAE